MTGQVFALASGKGGVGKTTVVANLGVALRSAGHSVVLVDADLGMANLATLLDVDGERTIHDILAGDSTVDAAIEEAASGFGVLAGSRDLVGFAAADPEGLGAVFETLAENYEYVLVDTGAGLSYEDVLPLGLVDDVILVTTPEPAAVGDTAKTAELTTRVGGSVRGVVVNRTTGTRDPEAIAAELGTELLGTIPEDRAVTESAMAGTPIEVHAPDSSAATAFARLGRVITGETEPEETAKAETTTEESDVDERTDESSDEAASSEETIGEETAKEETSGGRSTDEKGDSTTGSSDSESKTADDEESKGFFRRLFSLR